MADNKKTATSKKASSKAPTNSESPRILQALKLMANFCVLKYCSDREHPLRSEDVSNIIFTYSGTNCDARETKRKLVYLTNLHLRAQNEIEISVTDTSIPPLPDRDECYYIDTIITSLTGGYIAATEKSYGRRFWFEQLMDCSDAELIQGAITSNQYLSGEEKDFLVTCLKNIFPPNISKYTNAQYLIDFTKPTKLDANTMAALLEEKFQNTMDSYTLPYNPKRTQKINNNFSQKGTPDLMNFLETVNVLRDAIENGLDRKSVV